MKWIDAADDGDHFRLAFDRPGTWSQKYNLVWDRLLGLGYFPPRVMQKEMRFYQRVQNKYGLPLDNRATYTKLDWIVWSATLTGDRADFESLVDPVHLWVQETPSRVPMTDWYDTVTGRQRGFQARPVVGGVFLPMLYHPDIWSKYASRDVTRASNWAPMPVATVVVPSARDAEVRWRYTTRSPGGDWAAPDFDDSGWSEGVAGFGTRNTPGTVVRTVWQTSEIWIRREFELPADADPESLQLFIHHDEDAEVYFNGVRVAELKGYTTSYRAVALSEKAVRALRPGRNVMAIHCRQTGGGQYIDAGLVVVRDAPLTASAR